MMVFIWSGVASCLLAIDRNNHSGRVGGTACLDYTGFLDGLGQGDRGEEIESDEESFKGFDFHKLNICARITFVKRKLI